MTLTPEQRAREDNAIDLAILAWFGARLSGESTETAAEHAKAMLTFFDVRPEETTHDR